MKKNGNQFCNYISLPKRLENAILTTIPKVKKSQYRKRLTSLCVCVFFDCRDVRRWWLPSDSGIRQPYDTSFVSSSTYKTCIYNSSPIVIFSVKVTHEVYAVFISLNHLLKPYQRENWMHKKDSQCHPLN